MDFIPIILDILSKTIYIYLGVFVGFIFMRTPLSKYKSKFIDITINFFTPLLILVSFINIDLQDYWYVPVLAGLLVTGIGLITPLIITILMGDSRPKPAEICTSSFSNALNFPYPIIFAFAPDGLGYAGIFLAVSIIMRNTVGLAVSGVKMDRENILSIIKFPPIWGIIIGIIFRSFYRTETLSVVNLPVIQFIFQIGIFATLMTVGFSLKKIHIDYKKPIFRVSISRFIVPVILLVILLSIVKYPSDVTIPLIVQSMAPPAVYNGLYAEKFNLDTELTSQVIIALTMIALIILPVELYIVQIFI